MAKSGVTLPPLPVPVPVPLPKPIPVPVPPAMREVGITVKLKPGCGGYRATRVNLDLVVYPELAETLRQLQDAYDDARNGHGCKSAADALRRLLLDVTRAAKG